MGKNNIRLGLSTAKKRNLKDNLDYIDMYSNYVLTVSNKVWSKGQKKFLDMLYSKKRRSKNAELLKRYEL